MPIQHLDFTRFLYHIHHYIFEYLPKGHGKDNVLSFNFICLKTSIYMLFLVCVGKLSWRLGQVLEEVACLGLTLSGSKGCLMALY